MNIGIEKIIQNLGLDFESIILILVVCGGFIFYGKDFKLGVVMQLIGTGCLFIWFYESGYNYIPSLTVFLMTIVMLSFSLLLTAKHTQAGGAV